MTRAFGTDLARPVASTQNPCFAPTSKLKQLIKEREKAAKKAEKAAAAPPAAASKKPKADDEATLDPHVRPLERLAHYESETAD